MISDPLLVEVDDVFTHLMSVTALAGVKRGTY
jgi:hypothetical protein